MPEMSPVSKERTLAANSAEILACPDEFRSTSGRVSRARRGEATGARGESGRAPAPLPVPTPSPRRPTDAKTDQLLRSILDQLRRMQTKEMFGEFSLMRLLAGIMQVFVPFCLLLALWFLTGSRRQDNNVFLALCVCGGPASDGTDVLHHARTAGESLIESTRMTSKLAERRDVGGSLPELGGRRRHGHAGVRLPAPEPARTPRSSACSSTVPRASSKTARGSTRWSTPTTRPGPVFSRCAVSFGPRRRMRRSS